MWRHAVSGLDAGGGRELVSVSAEALEPARVEGQRLRLRLAGVEADRESRTLFVLGWVESMLPTVGPDFHKAELRLGVAPYEAEFDELASWLMVQAQWHSELTRSSAITPLGRFFYKNVLWETGGQPRRRLDAEPHVPLLRGDHENERIENRVDDAGASVIGDGRGDPVRYPG
jgi:hypothetical protein